jgi:hypothetical protein
MKSRIGMLALLLLVTLFAPSCATVGRLNAEYEEETVRIEQMSPEDQANCGEERRLEEKIDVSNWID